MNEPNLNSLEQEDILKTIKNLSKRLNFLESEVLRDKKIFNRYKLIYKATNETVNNSDALQADDELILPVGANEIWAVHVHLKMESNTSADIKFGWTYPTGTTITWTFDDYPTSALAENNIYAVATTGTTAQDIGTSNAMVYVGSTAGDLTVTWAQNSAHGSNTIVYQGSNIFAKRLA